MHLRAVIDDGVHVRPALELPLPVHHRGQRCDDEERSRDVVVLPEYSKE